jgi:hypothetical protein
MSVIENMRRRNEPHKVEMPRAANVPPARVYDDDVLQQLQRWKDLQIENDRLRAESDDWRREALDAQREVKRLEGRLAQDGKAHEEAITKLADERDRKIDGLTQERDVYKVKLGQFETKVVLQAQSVLDLAGSVSNLAGSVSGKLGELLEEMRKERGGGAPDVAGSLGLAAIAEAIEAGKDAADMPRVVSAGPRDYPGGESAP